MPRIITDFLDDAVVAVADKIAFVDSFQDGKLSYLLSLIDKFKEDYNGLAKTKSIFWGNILVISLINNCLIPVTSVITAPSLKCSLLVL